MCREVTARLASDPEAGGLRLAAPSRGQEAFAPARPRAQDDQARSGVRPLVVYGVHRRPHSPSLRRRRKWWDLRPQVGSRWDSAYASRSSSGYSSPGVSRSSPRRANAIEQRELEAGYWPGSGRGRPLPAARPDGGGSSSAIQSTRRFIWSPRERPHGPDLEGWRLALRTARGRTPSWCGVHSSLPPGRRPFHVQLPLGLPPRRST